MATSVLLIEDNPGDVRLMREILLGTNNSLHLLVASDGVEAMEFLQRKGSHIHAPRPALILLDLNLPRMDGREVLASIKADISLRTIPIIVLTTSNADTDIVKCYQLQANCYLCKPGQLSEYEQLMESINRFWLAQAKLPESGTTLSPACDLAETELVEDMSFC